MEVAPRSHHYAILRALIELDNADKNNFDVHQGTIQGTICEIKTFD